ncbi:MAG: MBL fold metallo-hydrolase [Bacteroidales bacterium]|nr:MBL fold metallo-hydrolase [Bacteroidales bacterium]
MKVTFLGTGTSQGVPVIACGCRVCTSGDSRDKRLRTSALVEIGGKNILIDIGPDFREQMLRTSTSHLDAILITHHHRDHVAGIDDIRSFNYVQHKPMDIYSGQITLDVLQRDYHYIFEKHQFKGLPEANLHPVDNLRSFIVADGIEVIPIAVMHKDLPIFGYRIGDFSYITDANFISYEEMKKLHGTKTLVINALRKEKHFSHYCLPEALEVIRQVNPEKAYLTHISHSMGLHADVSEELPHNVQLAYDGLTIEI